MNERALLQRIADLEKRVAELEAALTKLDPPAPKKATKKAEASDG